MSGINYQIWNKMRQEVQDAHNLRNPKPWSVHRIKEDEDKIPDIRLNVKSPVSFAMTLKLKNDKEHYFDLDYKQGGLKYE